MQTERVRRPRPAGVVALHAAVVALACALPGSMAMSADEAAVSDAVLFPISVRDRHGAIDRRGTVVIPPEYDDPVEMREGLARVRKGPRTAYLDASGRRVIEPQDRTTALFSEGMAPALGTDDKGKGAWGYLDRRGAWAIAPRFADAKEFSGGRAAVGVADEWGRVKFGYIDAKGVLVIPATFDRAFPFGRVARVELERRARLIDLQGRDVTPEGIDGFGAEAGGMRMARKGKLVCFLDEDGRLAIELQFASASDFKDGMARVWRDGRYGYVDRKGTLVVPPTYESASDFSGGYAAVAVDRRYGFIDRTGKMAIAPQFERVQAFSDGLAAAQSEKLWGFVDANGRWAIPPRFQWVRPFHNGLAWVGEPRQRGGSYVDPEGRVVWSTPAD